MKKFAGLFTNLDQSNKTSDKLEALKYYFLEADDSDRIWTLALFTHRRPRRAVNTKLLRAWCGELSGVPDWLFEECYHTVGDLAETISLLLPETEGQQDESLTYWIEFLINLSDLEETEKKEKIIQAWKVLNKEERFVFIKIMTGGFRVGVSQNLVVQAIAEAFGLEKSEVAHRIMGDWSPLKDSFEQLLLTESTKSDLSKPYPFYLAHPLDKSLEELGDILEWQIEWKWDGIRGQLIQREQQHFLWSRGEELVTDKFPELAELALTLPSGTVLDGEILAFRDNKPLPFSILQTRIGRKTLSKKILKDAPVVFMAYDVLEYNNQDIREMPLQERRNVLDNLLASLSHPNILSSPLVKGKSWQEIDQLMATAREMMAEGFMLKHLHSPYEAGRKRGRWWKWKIEPMTIDGVLLYAQKGHGRRADLFTDYTFAVWDEGKLVPFAKAYSGLTDSEIKEVDKFIKQHTLEKFGPVRTVKPFLVFEIAFEGIQESPRHKSGIALRFPRIQRWRKDKKLEEANTLKDLKSLLSVYEG